MVLITVLLPAYNAEAYICRAIDSILTQTFTDFELLVINDGSTDSTQRLVESYTDPRIRLVNMAKNSGLINALNHGLDLANRKYLARMDADDVCLPTRLEKQFQFLEQHKDYIACGTSIINFNTTSESYMQYPETNEQIKTALFFFERNICHPTVMIRREPLEKHKIRYRSDYTYAEDYVFWHELAQIGKLYNIKEGLLRYYRHEDQVSTKYYPQQMAISRNIVKGSLSTLWPDITESQLQDILRLCVHEVGIYPDSHFSIHKVNKTILWILDKNKKTKNFNPKALKKLLYFKKFRCSFYYRYPFNYSTKLWFFLIFLSVEPLRASQEIAQMIQGLMLQKIKRVK